MTPIEGRVSAGFTGHEHDDALGVINMRRRIYRAARAEISVARSHREQWLRAAWNAYSYVMNSPLQYVDPSGYMPERHGNWTPPPRVLGTPGSVMAAFEACVSGADRGACGAFMDDVGYGTGVGQKMSVVWFTSTTSQSQIRGHTNDVDSAAADEQITIQVVGEGGVAPGDPVIAPEQSLEFIEDTPPTPGSGSTAKPFLAGRRLESWKFRRAAASTRSSILRVDC